LVVVDRGSTDETGAIARDIADVVEVWGPERSAQRNRGASISQGEYLLFVDSDMALSGTVVEDCLATSRSTGAPAVVIPETTVGAGFWARCRGLERSCYTGDDSVEAARFFARDQFFSVRGFDESLTGPEDWDLSRRVALGQHLPRTTSRITHDEGRLRLRTMLSKRRYYAPGYWAYWRKHKMDVLAQANLVARPAFLRNWRRLGDHPLLAAGLMGLKSCELLAVLAGFVDMWLRVKFRKPTKPELG
jgi:arabinofuranan 3-O-arabinosyltransferase